MSNLRAGIFVLSTLIIACFCDNRRPIYNIGHMVNSIEEINTFLDLGANVLELDIQFDGDGSIREVHHGEPCDLGRHCEGRANLEDYLKHVRKITDPSTTPKNYSDQMVMLIFDLKLDDGINLGRAGKEVARHVLDFLWSKDRERKQEVRVLLYIDEVTYKDVINGFNEEFKRRKEEKLLRFIGFDGGSGDIEEIQEMFANLDGQENIWIGDGITNYLSAVYPITRLKKELQVRDSLKSAIKKVYHWTIDSQSVMQRSLELGVDGILTNRPQDFLKVLKNFQKRFRLATPMDNPFQRY